MKKSVLVIFSEGLPKKSDKWWRQFEALIAPKRFEETAQKHNLIFKDVDELIEAGSIYEASAFLEGLSYLTLPDGSRISKSFIYKGYELWWMHYNGLFLYFCLPYTQYKKLLEYLKSFQNIYLYQPPYKSLFTYYLQAYGCKFNIIREQGIKSPYFLPFGVLLQILITIVSIPILMVRKRRIMLFTGDKFDKSKDYDFRMKFIYEELRQRNLHFVEFIRSLEPWKKVLQHVFVRRRPVIYSEGVAFVGRFVGFITGGHRRAKRKFGLHIFTKEIDSEKRFEFLIATQYLLSVYDDIWATQIMKWILRVIGIKVAYITAVLDRNFNAFLGCKLNAIPTVGILHGISFCNYNVYDFLPAYDGEKILSVDKYGLWSKWWKEYYLKNSKAYRPEQLYVSGPMRPLIRDSKESNQRKRQDGLTRVLFVSEQLAVPEEVLPYLNVLMGQKDIYVCISFRPYRDNFEIWLKNNKPEILDKFDSDKTFRSGISDAISKCDMVVGCHSTAVLESLFELKPMVFFSTKKWGDYSELKDYDSKYKFFAENPEELINCVRRSKKIPIDALKELQERFFGDPHKNGGKWVVDQLEKVLGS